MPLPIRSASTRQPQGAAKASAIPTAQTSRGIDARETPLPNSRHRSFTPGAFRTQHSQMFAIGQRDQRASAEVLECGLSLRAGVRRKVPVTRAREPSVASMAVDSTSAPRLSTQKSATSIPKPQFSSYQQRYTPKKEHSRTPSLLSTNGLPSTSIAQGPDAWPIAGAEIRIELHQLQLIHQSSHEMLARFTTSASSKLMKRYEKIFEDAKSVEALEKAHESDRSHNALQDWLAKEGRYVASQKLTILSGIIEDLKDLTRPEGQLSQLFIRFDDWLASMVPILEVRAGADTLLHPVLQPLRRLGEGWIEQVATIHRKVECCLQTLRELGEADQKSGIGRVIDIHQRLAEVLTKELESCASIQKSAMKNEREWIDAAVAQALKESQAPAVDSTMNRRGAWAHA